MLKIMLKGGVFVISMIFASSAMSQERLLPYGECALIVGARQTLSEVNAFVEQVQDRRFLSIYASRNNWYAISVGTLKPHEVDSVIGKWKAAGRIPDDSYCTFGKNFLYEVDAHSGEKIRSRYAGQSSPESSHGSNRANCAQMDYDTEVAACYALVLGPKACTQYVSESRIPGADTFAERIAISTACSAATNATFAKDFLPSDMMGVLIDETLEAGCEKIESENIFAQIFVGLPFCITNLAVWEQKIATANECAAALERTCGD